MIRRFTSASAVGSSLINAIDGTALAGDCLSTKALQERRLFLWSLINVCGATLLSLTTIVLLPTSLLESGFSDLQMRNPTEAEDSVLNPVSLSLLSLSIILPFRLPTASFFRSASTVYLSMPLSPHFRIQFSNLFMPNVPRNKTSTFTASHKIIQALGNGLMKEVLDC